MMTAHPRLPVGHFLATPAAAAVLTVALASGAWARTFTVNSTTDAVDANPGDGVCETAAGNRVCTLRAAVMETNNIIGPNTIDLPAGTYTLTIPGAGEDAAATGDLDIANFLTIVGGGRDVTVVDAGGLDRIFQVLNVNVNLSNLTLKGGNARGDNGGAILAGQYGIVALDQVTLADNRGYGGGALLTPGATIKLVDVDIARNRSSSSGGGIYVGGPLSMSGGIIKDNIADGAGGGVANFADTHLSDVVIQGNWARGGAGGGIYNVQALSLTGAIVEGNAGSGGGGGCTIKALRPYLPPHSSRIRRQVLVEACTLTVAHRCLRMLRSAATKPHNTEVVSCLIRRCIPRRPTFFETSPSPRTQLHRPAGCSTTAIRSPLHSSP